MPKIEDHGEGGRLGELTNLPCRPVRCVARANHEIPAVGQEWCNEIVVVFDVVLEICILKQHDVSAAGSKTSPDSVTLTARPVLQDEPHSRVRTIAARVLARAIR